MTHDEAAHTDDFQRTLAAAKRDPRDHGIFADYLEEHDLHHDGETLHRMREAADRSWPLTYHKHAESGKVIATPQTTYQQVPWSLREVTGRHSGPGGDHLTGPANDNSGAYASYALDSSMHPYPAWGTRETVERIATRRADAGHTRLARGDRGVFGWIAPDGTYTPHERDHHETAVSLGFSGHQGAHDAGYMHVAENGGDLHGHHPQGTYTGMQIARLRQLARDGGHNGIEVSQMRGNTLSTRQLRLSRVEEHEGRDDYERTLYGAKAADPWEDLPHGVFMDYLTEHDLHHDEEHNRLVTGPRVYHKHTDSGKVVASTGRPDSISGPGGSYYVRDMGGNEPSHWVFDYETGKRHGMHGQYGLAQAEARHRAELGHTRLAAMKAPAGGAITNNQQKQGGQFLPRAFQTVGSVIRRLRAKYAAEVTRLAKEEVQPGSEVHTEIQATKDSSEPLHHEMLMDLLSDRGLHHDEHANRTAVASHAPAVSYHATPEGRVIVSPNYVRPRTAPAALHIIVGYSHGPGGSYGIGQHQWGGVQYYAVHGPFDGQNVWGMFLKGPGGDNTHPTVESAKTHADTLANGEATKLAKVSEVDPDEFAAGLSLAKAGHAGVFMDYLGDRDLHHDEHANRSAYERYGDGLVYHVHKDTGRVIASPQHRPATGHARLAAPGKRGRGAEFAYQVGNGILDGIRDTAAAYGVPGFDSRPARRAVRNATRPAPERTPPIVMPVPTGVPTARTKQVDYAAPKPLPVVKPILPIARPPRLPATGKPVSEARPNADLDAATKATPETPVAPAPARHNPDLDAAFDPKPPETPVFTQEHHEEFRGLDNRKQMGLPLKPKEIARHRELENLLRESLGMGRLEKWEELDPADREPMLAEAKTGFHGPFMDYLTDRDAHHDEAANRTTVNAGPVVYHAHRESGKVIASPAIPEMRYRHGGRPAVLEATISGPGGAFGVTHSGAALVGDPDAILYPGGGYSAISPPHTQLYSVVQHGSGGISLKHPAHIQPGEDPLAGNWGHHSLQVHHDRDAAVSYATALADAGHTRLSKEARDALAY